MAIKSKDELLNSIKGLLKDDTSDESISLLEDVTDTFANFESGQENENYKQKYEEKAQEVEDWRKKYRDRFFNTGSEDNPKKMEEPEPEPPKKTFDDLFTVKE